MVDRRVVAALVALVVLGGGTALGVAAGGSGDATGQAPVPTVPTRLRADRFDGARALRLAALQLRYGQRTAGSDRLRALAVRLRALLPRGHFEPVGPRFGDPDGRLRNVVGELPGRGKAIVLGAHYDVLASPAGFVGADNGAAGTAVVLELARALARAHRPPDAPPVRFVLFDGEEPAQGLPEQQADFATAGLRGSRAYVAAHPGQTREMLLFDYVGNRGLRLPFEPSGDAALWARLRAAAARVGAGVVFPGREEVGITDDHTPFERAGVPAVDLIDWSYPGHRLGDDLDRLSAASLDAVGESTLALLLGR